MCTIYYIFLFQNYCFALPLSFCINTTDCVLHCSFFLSPSFSAISKTEREQEKLVWSQSLRGGDS